MKYETYTLEQFDKALALVEEQVLDSTKVVLIIRFADGKEVNFHGIFALLTGNKDIAAAQHRPDDS